MPIDLDQLLQEAGEYAESLQPIDVPILVGSRILTARIPCLYGDAMTEAIAPHRYSNPLYRDWVGSWFSIPNAARAHPGIVLIDGDEEDDLFVLRDQQAVYRWPEVYGALMDEDRLAVQSAIWGMYVKEPQQRRADAVNADE